MRQQLKPHGKIVIQQQPQANGNIEEISLHQNNLKSSQGNRRHSSILKGEHQNKQMIMIDQHNNVSSKQGHKNRIPQNPNQRRKFGQSPELGQE
jgi:SRSO17 transposase